MVSDEKKIYSGLQRNRTPSGQIITPKVGSIAGFFEFGKKGHKEESSSKGSQVLQLSDLKFKQVGSALIGHGPVFTDSNKSLPKQLSQLCMIKEMCSIDQAEAAEVQKHQTLEISIDEHIKSAMQENMEVQDSAQDNPPTMSVATVVQMFQNLKSEINSKIDAMAEKGIEKIIENKKDAISSLERSMQHQDDTITQLQNELKACKISNSVLAGNSCRLTSTIQELQSRIEKLEAGSAKRMASTVVSKRVSIDNNYRSLSVRSFMWMLNSKTFIKQARQNLR